MAFIALEHLHKLHDGYRRVFRLGRDEWVLLQEDGKLYCFANRCPHLGAPLHQASLDSYILRCPAHGMEFDVRSGRPMQPAMCQNPLRFLPLAYEKNQVGVYLDS